MENIILLFATIVAGWLIRRSGIVGDQGAPVLNRLLIYFFIPVIALHRVPKITLELHLIWLTIIPFAIFGCSWLYFQLLGRILALKRDVKAALILTAGISSTSFVGFPIFEILYGAEGLAYGIILSLSGTILVFNTVGIGTLAYYTSEENDLLGIIKSILRFPPFLFFVLAMILNVTGLELPYWLDQVLGRLSSPFVVLALLSIGMQIELRQVGTLLPKLALGQSFKLLLAPFLVYLLVWHLLELQDTLGKVCILGAAIGSMNAMSILTADKGLEPQLAILMPAFGIPLSIPVLLLIDYFLLSIVRGDLSSDPTEIGYCLA